VQRDMKRCRQLMLAERAAPRGRMKGKVDVR
jgi:hypothetical protein